MARQQSKPSSIFAKLDHARCVLGLAEVVSFAQIRKAYHDQSCLWHPDHHEAELARESTDRMQEVNEAYKTLKDYFYQCPISLRKEDLLEPLDVGAWWWNHFGNVFGQEPDDSG